MDMSKLTDLQQAIARHCSQKVNKTAFDFLVLYRTETVTDPVLVVYEPRIYIVVQGEKILYLNDYSFTYNESQYLISTLDLPVSGRITRATAEKPYLALCISFSSLEIEHILKENSSFHTTPPPRTARPAMGLSHITDDLLDNLLRLIQLLDDANDQSFLAKLYKMELLYRFLQGEQGHVLYEISRGQSDVSHITRAINYLRHHFQEQFEISTLVNIAGMSQSNFYKRFGELTGMTPVQYRMKLRLQEARRLMLSKNMNAANAGFLVGYESPSQFNRDYKRIFGRPPHADMKHIRTIGVEAYKNQHEDVWF